MPKKPNRIFPTGDTVVDTVFVVSLAALVLMGIGLLLMVLGIEPFAPDYKRSLLPDGVPPVSGHISTHSQTVLPGQPTDTPSLEARIKRAPLFSAIGLQPGTYTVSSPIDKELRLYATSGIARIVAAEAIYANTIRQSQGEDLGPEAESLVSASDGSVSPEPAVAKNTPDHP